MLTINQKCFVLYFLYFLLYLKCHIIITFYWKVLIFKIKNYYCYISGCLLNKFIIPFQTLEMFSKIVFVMEFQIETNNLWHDFNINITGLYHVKRQTSSFQKFLHPCWFLVARMKWMIFTMKSIAIWHTNC